jgi:hypothetical protein
MRLRRQAAELLQVTTAWLPVKPYDIAREGIRGLTLSEIHPDAVTTAYGPLADVITIAGG